MTRAQRGWQIKANQTRPEDPSYENSKLSTLALLVAFTTPAMAQNGASSPPPAAAAESTTKAAPAKVSLYRPMEIQHIRPADQRGVNVFESPKDDEVAFNGFTLSFGGAFTQEFQGLHTQTGERSGDQRRQREPAHHHRPRLQQRRREPQHQRADRPGHPRRDDVVPVGAPPPGVVGQGRLSRSSTSRRSTTRCSRAIMKYTTLRVGHFEINYGDQHFRRSDNGNAMYNPFVGNYILDDFTTEIGAEVYVRANGFMAMARRDGRRSARPGDGSGEARSMAYLASSASTRSFGDNFRFRLTGSFYANDKSASNTLFTGDRGGSRYYDVLENTASTETANAWSGKIRPGFSNKVNARKSINPFIKVGGAGVLRQLRDGDGRRVRTEPKLRTLHQNVVRRCCTGSSTARQFYVGARYNTLKGAADREDRHRSDGQSLPGRRRLVRDAERAREARVREPEVQRLPDHRHPQRRQVQGLHDRGRGRLLRPSP